MLKFAESLIDWYWRFGIRRQGSYAIGVEWLDRAYECRRLAAVAEKTDARPALGVWGPSASGKSTLISYLIDDADGRDSAVNWTKETPFSFVGQEQNADALALNPWNRGKDASACVARFIMRGDKEILDRAYPVRLTFGSNQQFLHALASGFLSETDAKNSVVVFDEVSFLKKLGAKSETRAATPELFEALHELADVIGQLIRAGDSRFVRLGNNDRWQRAIRKELLGTKRLLAGNDELDQFVFDLLWNGNEVLTSLYRGLQAISAPFREPRLSRNVYCSLEAAALLLDMETYNSVQGADAIQGNNAELRRRAALISRLSWTERNGTILIGQDLGQPLLKSQRDLGLLQGAVWEIEVPLRRDYLEGRAQKSDASAAFFSFLDRADLIDFPGVANEGEKAKSKEIIVEDVHADQKELFTELLKRGKTSSIVSAYTRSLAIDEFLILARAQQFPVNPAQIENQIEQWWTTADPSFQPRNVIAEAPLPVSLGMTFFATTVDGCATSIGAGLGPVFDLLDKLGSYTDASLSTLFALSYPRFRDGLILSSDEILQRIVKEIRADSHFRKRFVSDVSLGSFDAMIQNARQRHQDGGVGYLFRHLMGISAEPKARQLRRIRENARRELDLLMTSPLPPRADGPTPGARLQEFANAIAAYVASAPEHEEFERCAECGRFIREVLYFAIDDIDPLPTNLPEQTRSRVLREYVGRQFESWKARKAALRLPMQDQDVDVRQFVFAIGDLTIQECANDLTRWLRDNLSHIDNTESARYVREYVALAFSNAMLHGRAVPSGPAAATVSRTPGVFTDERRLLEFMRQAGERSPRSFGSEFLTVLSLQSPDYRLVVAPFLRRIEQLAKGSPLDRQPQAGDAELQALYAALGAA